ncbi:MAG: thiamine phosphate synthase [Gordonibacter pamelaeae]|uniref:thiamine phosphate synthase n=1 Tax=Gordonibacter massiliensis (ex Traore et al. 2017) TaxID=1841863 RepID=UPI001C8B4FD1|nr:thiamine phosphate synthase [Gordonibacter massiliensis (ex Traore et al. 2017)]MBX9034340.1 thiamine phosphate synthase [Gordonibacter massiliensis (ex Traore et al. 2017)]
MRNNLDITAYLVLGPENTAGRPVGDVIEAALAAGFTCVQVRSKECSARQLMEVVRAAAGAIERVGAAQRVALLVDDRLDVALAARAAGVKVDGVHVGQSDVPVEVCRRYLGEDGVVGLSARTDEMLEYVRTVDTDCVDYLGAGPLHETATKPDCGMDAAGNVITRSLADLAELARTSPLPVVVGGGVKAADIPALARTGVDGFFVVSAVCAAPDPGAAARELVEAWRAARA